METRKSDPRIYIVVFLFLSCIVSGGILLGLYVILPLSDPLYLLAGMVLVGVPWLFWLLAYLYRCIIKPCASEISQEADLNKENKKKDDMRMKKAASPRSPKDSALDDPTAAKTPRDDGERRVQFGSITVIENEEEDSTNRLMGQNRSDEQETDHEDIEKGDRGDKSDQRRLRFSSRVTAESI